MQTPRTEFAQALKAIATERGLDAAVILDTIKQAIIAAYRRDAKERGEDTEEMDFDVELDPVSGETKIFAWPLEKPKERKDVTPPGFGRIAAQTAKQVIHQKIREAEKGAIMEEFSGRAGNLVSGMILRFDGPNVRVDMGRTEAVMPVTERIPNERLTPNQRMSFLLKEIIEGIRGKEIILSRADPAFVQKLFAREVPEVSSGSVVIRQIAREPGVRTKIAVVSEQSGVDPVGSCVGQKGVRVQAVTNELGGERVDIIPWSEDMRELISASLSPAENITVSLDEKSKVAKVRAPEDQLSLAIGKEGQNVRLAAKLTGWRIEVEGIPGEKVEEVSEVKEEKEPETILEQTEKKEDVSEDTSIKQTKPKKVAKKKKEEEKEPEEAPETADKPQE
ncbi:transcription termination factor NusA [Candidatus Woesebacteria bacterium RIFCSPHIGHO2_12_FULL_42_9]|uniref:Transcription termination/antitermination protein NusA n=3 Tax=Candidatus Woeseibacteriota TaxID=1752722 RepID=A0A1F8AQN7_9BACT|nr:MAG: Transcription termination factor NusA [Candidatus Woesebacteria bacterium GW2011_GWA1_39_12]OGM06412.1 MAG: transcription termination factor NusA [Candidatus Woesebacteria bacterium GWC1_42_13]OGM54066.1 MAG: transcription termination factor NusA [Candidatus Woesebacteria bacterium RIFCSPHIGHO2_12_FULL_42_9]